MTEIQRVLLKQKYWRPNPNPDFTPYRQGNNWYVSIQYLGVWKYKSKEDATADLPALRNYRLSTLRRIEQSNQLYYKRIESKQEQMLEEIRQRRAPQPKTFGVNHLTSSQRKRLIDMIRKGATELQCKEKFDISTYTYAGLKVRYYIKDENIQDK